MTIKPARKRIYPAQKTCLFEDDEVVNERDMAHMTHKTGQRVTPTFAKWEPPAKFLRQQPREMQNVPFAEDKDYIYADGFDRGVAAALFFGTLVYTGVTIWEWMQ